MDDLRLMRILTRPNVGGPARQAVALWRAHKHLGVRTLMVVGYCSRGEPSLDLEATGIPMLTPREARAAGPQAEGIVVLRSMRRRPRVPGDWRTRRVLQRLMRTFEPHVVHTHMTKAGWLGRRAARRMKVEVIAHTFHGHVLRDYYSSSVSEILRRREARLAQTTDLLFAVSASCRREIEEMDIGRGRVQVVPPAVDMRPFSQPRQESREAARRELGIAHDRLAVGFVGRMVPIKRPDLFVEAMGELPRAWGFMFGDGPERKNLERATAGMPVKFMGATSELQRLLPGLDVLLIPSEREGCPLAAIEAFAAGVPVVGFDVPGVSDVLDELSAGLTVPRADGARGLAWAALGLMRDEVGRSRMVESARARLPQFDAARVARVYVDAYAEARRAGRGRRATGEDTEKGAASSGG